MANGSSNVHTPHSETKLQVPKSTENGKGNDSTTDSLGSGIEKKGN